MKYKTISPKNIPESLVWYCIILTYPIYFLGAQFVVIPLLATFLTFYLLFKLRNQTEDTPPEEKIIISTPAWIWIISVIVIEFALIIAHLNFNLEVRRILTSTLLWYRTWALLALFPLIGHLNIRPQLIYRAVCILCLQSLIYILICTLSNIVGIPNLIYLSPLKVLGGGDKFYEVEILENWTIYRLRLFAMWPTFLAAVANIYFLLSSQEKNKILKFIGMFTSIFMVIASQSRAATIGLPLTLAIVWLLTNSLREWVQFSIGFLSLITSMFFPTMIDSLRNIKRVFDNFRSGSSQVRKMIYTLSLEKWQKGAPIWGFGVREEQGPPIVALMPLGSHHTWIGILYSHGLVGCIALGFAFLWSFIDLLIKAQNSEIDKIGLSIFLIISIASLADNIESLAYLCYPGLIFLGIAFKESTLIERNNILLTCK